MSEFCTGAGERVNREGLDMRYEAKTLINIPCLSLQAFESCD